MASIRYRACSISDIPAILALWREARAEPRPKDDASALRRCLANDAGSIIGAWEGTRLVGVIIAAWDGWHGNLYRLAVAPDSRRRGIANELVRRAEQRLARQGAWRMTALVVSDNRPSLSLFRKRGWRLHHEDLRLAGPAKRSERRTQKP